jgi:hypothetical protein
MLPNFSSPRRFLVAVTGGGTLVAIMAGCVAAAECPPIPKKDHYTVGFAQISNGNFLSPDRDPVDRRRGQDARL